MLDQHQEAFIEEANELLAELEASLLELEQNKEDPDLVAQVFRAMHTIKGSGAMFGFDSIADFTHEVETVFDLVRNGRIPVTQELVNLSLGACDQIKDMLHGARAGEAGFGAGVGSEDLIAKFRALLPENESHAAVASEFLNTGAESVQPVVTYRIRFCPPHDLFLGGTNPVGLLNELRELGSCRVIAQTEKIPSLEEMEAEHCYTYWDVVLTSDRGLEAIRDVFIFVEDDSDISVEAIDEGEFLDADAVLRLGDILVERGDVSRQAIEEILGNRRRLGELLVEAQAVPLGKVESALAEQQQVQKVQERQGSEEGATTLRVPADRLDRLVDLVGELVTVQSRLSQTAAAREDTELLSIAEEVQRLTEELRDNTLNIRMLPIGTTFSRFKRLVRDLSMELGKEVELTTSGAETELDKTVIDKLGDPLVHLIRNSIDHGIESPEDRAAFGKHREGSIHLSAEHSGDSVFIEIRDDGRGLDLEAIRRRAVERGLIGEQEDCTEQQLTQLLFAPGFSTAREVTNVSGRGVGMDVVKRSIEALRGSIEMNSVSGQGTTIRVKLPLTLAIIESLLVEIGQEKYVLPLSLVEECVELCREDVVASHGRNLANVRGKLVPYIGLRQQFGIDGTVPDIEQIVITRVNQSRVGFVVDHVIGEHQTVIKSLGRLYSNVEGVSGATILGDGTVALILDAQQLVFMAERQDREGIVGKQKFGITE